MLARIYDMNMTRMWYLEWWKWYITLQTSSCLNTNDYTWHSCFDFSLFCLISFSMRRARHLVPNVISAIGSILDTTKIIEIIKHVHCTPIARIPRSTVAVPIALNAIVHIRHHLFKVWPLTYAKVQRTRLLVAVMEELSSGNRSTINTCIELKMLAWVKQTRKDIFSIG